MEKIFKVFNAEIKSVDHADHTVEVIVSTGSVDRHMESVQPEAFKKRLATYKAHPVLLSSHDYNDLRKQIGEAQSVKVKDGALVAKFKYYFGEGNPEADWAFALASKKVAAYSIGFIGHGFEDSQESYESAKEKGTPLRTYTDVELIEISQVLIPSNRDAVQERAGVVVDGVPDCIAELCTKALAEKTLDYKPIAGENMEKKDLPKIDPVPSALILKVKTEIDGRMDDAKNGMIEVLKKEIGDALRGDAELKKEIASGLLELLKTDGEKKKILKAILLDAVEDIVADEFYRELLFGKVAPKSQQLSPKELGESLKKIAHES